MNTQETWEKLQSQKWGSRYGTISKSFRLCSLIMVASPKFKGLKWDQKSVIVAFGASSALHGVRDGTARFHCRCLWVRRLVSSKLSNFTEVHKPRKGAHGRLFLPFKVLLCCELKWRCGSSAECLPEISPAGRLSPNYRGANFLQTFNISKTYFPVDSTTSVLRGWRILT